MAARNHDRRTRACAHPLLASLLLLGPAGCGGSDGEGTAAADDASSSDTGGTESSGFVVVSVVINDVGRTTYVTATRALEGTLTNDNGVEVPGSAIVKVQGRYVFVGLQEEPTWVKYRVNDALEFEEVGRMSLAAYGQSSIDFGNVIVDGDTAVSVMSTSLTAVVWNPETMTISGEVDLDHMADPSFTLENWTTTAHQGRVYIPGRWGSLISGTVAQRVHITILDPETLTVVGIAEDDRCYSGGRVVFGADGYGYVMADGRNYSAQVSANRAGVTPPENCLLRIAPGETDFDEEFYVSIPQLTGGVDSITEMQTVDNGTGIAFAKMFHPDQLPDGVEPIDFEFWNYPAHRLWRIDLGDEPVARPLEGAPFSIVGYPSAALDGKLYTGESDDMGGSATVYEYDPGTNETRTVFEMQGYFNGLFALEDI